MATGDNCNDFKNSKLFTALESFILRHQHHHRPMAIVTSGGTTAHLEKNSVRFLDNFSTGNRGAASVECLLQRGYAVIHVWRKGSASPYARKVAKKLGIQVPNFALDCNALDYLFYDPRIDSTGKRTNQKIQESHSQLVLHPCLSADEEIRDSMLERSKVQSSGLLLTVPFETVEEYLNLLQHCTEAVKLYNGMVMIYLAAAVSDFWVPPELRSLHKMDSSLPSSSQTLDLKLYPVPKVIGTLRKEWAPNAFCVSFKLETDPNVLEKKMRKAVERYGVHMVVGNILHTRNDKVYILHKQTNGDDFAVKVLKKKIESQIEDPMIDFIVQSHFEYISSLDVSSTLGIQPETLLNDNGKNSFHEFIQKRKKDMYTKLWNQRMRDLALQLCGSFLGMMASYYISSALRKRIEGSSK